MGDAAGTDQQHAFPAQLAQGLADAALQGRTEAARQGQLEHRDVRLRVHQAQRHPGAVVEWSLWVGLGRQAGGLEQFDRPLRQRRLAFGRVAHGVEGRRKAVEVVPDIRRRGAGYSQVVAFPVRGNHQDRLRPRQLCSQAAQLYTAGARFEGEHR